jgi:hypothetical protein
MFPYSDVNVDTILDALLDDMRHVTDGWLNGEPRDEPAFMNRATERLNRRRRKCDVGVKQPVEVESEFFVLHRRALTKRTSLGQTWQSQYECWEKTILRPLFSS